jgi:nucleoside-diphosphate-sugar epimerase
LNVKVIAVTGANGYVGSVLCQALVGEGRVLRLMRRPAQSADFEWSFVTSEYDLATYLKEKQVTHIVHAAWDMQTNRLQDLQAGCVDGSRRLVRAAQLVGTQVIFISTISAFAGARSAYGLAKLEVETMVLAAGGVVLRPGLIYGEGEGGAFGNLYKTIKRAKLVPLIGSGDAPQYLLHESTLAKALQCAVRGSLTAEWGPIALAHPDPIRFCDLLRTIADRVDRRVILLPVPWQMLYAGLWTAERLGLKLGFRSDSILSFVFQNPTPNFSQMQYFGIEPLPFL